MIQDDIMIPLSQQLTGDEGKSRTVYKDSRGLDTIGIGRLCDKSFPNSGLSDEEMLYLFHNDKDRTLKEALAEIPWINELDMARKGAILNMCFQMGAHKVAQFVNSWRELRAKNYEQMAKNLRASAWYGQTTNRANRIIKQLVTGEWQYEST